MFIDHPEAIHLNMKHLKAFALQMMQILVKNTDYDWQQDIMAKLNRIRIVLAEHDLNNKWLADKLGKDQATISKWVTNTTQPSLEALIAIANALEVPVQELVRQGEFNQEK